MIIIRKLVEDACASLASIPRANINIDKCCVQSRFVSYLGPRDVWGAPQSARNIKYARMYHFEKKHSKNFFPAVPRENVWGPRKNVSPGPAVALDGPSLSLQMLL